MFRLLLMTLPVLLTVPGAPPAPIISSPQQIAGELTAHEHAALAAFEQSVLDYVVLHRRLARLTTPLQVTADPMQLHCAVGALNESIRLARLAAQPGDVFTPAVTALFLRRIHRALRELDVTAVMAEIEEDEEPCAPRPVVNGPFPWNSGNAIWPSILAALPELPEELEYRFVGADLVLIDVPANLVVDILEDALTPDS
jgi:hypothetical protein